MSTFFYKIIIVLVAVLFINACNAQQETTYTSDYDIRVHSEKFQLIDYQYFSDAKVIRPTDNNFPIGVKAKNNNILQILTAYLSATKRADYEGLFCSKCNLPEKDFDYINNFGNRNDKIELLQVVIFPHKGTNYVSLKARMFNISGEDIGLSGILLKEEAGNWTFINREVDDDLMKYHTFFSKLKTNLAIHLLGTPYTIQQKGQDIPNQSLSNIIQKSRLNTTFNIAFFEAEIKKWQKSPKNDEDIVFDNVSIFFL